MLAKFFKSGIFILCLMCSHHAWANLNGNPQVKAFIQEMHREYGFNRLYLKWLFFNAHYDPMVLEKVTHPREGLPWDEYKKIFITEDRINKGLTYWQNQMENLHKASQQFGVPEQILVAILGVETNYGTNTGKFKAINALSTLAFYYPPRASFYRKELKNLLVLAKTAHLNPLKMYGSYSGALGMPQFMPSSYLHFGYFFANERDFLTSHASVIFSIGNYLQKNHWQPEGPIALTPQFQGTEFNTLVLKDPKKIPTPSYSLADLAKHGITLSTSHINFKPEEKGLLIALPKTDTDEYWLVFHNFYVLTRYNSSLLYAMAVFQLSEELQQRMG